MRSSDSGSYPCACCGYRTVSEGTRDTYEICPICFWEDDPVQAKDPNLAGGANEPSLRTAQSNFEAIGACERDALKHVRQPTAEDERVKDWRPL